MDRRDVLDWLRTPRKGLLRCVLPKACRLQQRRERPVPIDSRLTRRFMHRNSAPRFLMFRSVFVASFIVVTATTACGGQADNGFPSDPQGGAPSEDALTSAGVQVKDAAAVQLKVTSVADHFEPIKI